MSIEIPVYPEDVSAAFLSELVGELRPGVTVAAVDVVAVRGYGDADTSHSVSTSTQVSFEVRYGGAGHEGLPTRLLAKMPIPDEVECANPELGPLFGRVGDSRILCPPSDRNSMAYEFAPYTGLPMSLRCQGKWPLHASEGGHYAVRKPDINPH